MTERVLPYDRNIVPQETGYWCGPASTQVVLNSLGIHVPEPQLAREIGTHTGGTDHIGLITPILNRYTNAGYFGVQMLQDPPTREQVEWLWRDIVASINGGRGVVVNWVAPPSNYPRGVKGSVSPRYHSGTVYHYVAVMGYDDEAMAVWVADSGFQPQGYWLSLAQLATLIPPKGYAAAPGPDTPPPAPQPQSGMDEKVLARAMGEAVSAERYAKLAPAFIAAMVQAGCTTIERAAMWCAQLGHESGGLRYMEEIADGSAYEGRADLGNTQPGDGRRFKGRGPIQITGRYNYTKVSQWAHAKGYVPTPTYFVDNPTALADDRYGFLGAVWYWTVARDMNGFADRRDIVGATKAVNGGTNGLPDRTLRWNRCLEIGAALLPTQQEAPVGNIIEEGAGQLRPHKDRIRQIVRPENVSPSTRNPAEPWPYDIWADLWNEAVWDGYTIDPAVADVDDSVPRSLVALVRTMAARQVRIESKLDRLLKGDS